MRRAAGWTADLVDTALDGCLFAASPWHGTMHWGRVRVHGLDMARHYNLNPLVPSLFALFHDCRRWNEHFDPQHGERAADLVEQLATQDRLGMLGAQEVGWLQTACARHSDGLMDAPLAVQVCWDADRLDLARVGITPDPRRLCTARARDPVVLERAIAWSTGKGVRREETTRTVVTPREPVAPQSVPR